MPARYVEYNPAQIAALYHLEIPTVVRDEANGFVSLYYGNKASLQM